MVHGSTTQSVERRFALIASLPKNDQPQSTTGKGLRDHYRRSAHLSPQRLGHAPRSQIGTAPMTRVVDF
jgi:hypothetical protein